MKPTWKSISILTGRHSDRRNAGRKRSPCSIWIICRAGALALILSAAAFQFGSVSSSLDVNVANAAPVKIFGGSTGSTNLDNEVIQFVPMSVPSNSYDANSYDTEFLARTLMPIDGVITSFQCMLNDILTVPVPFSPPKSTEYECSLVINDFIVLQCDVQVKAHNAEGATVGCAQGADSPGISVFENDIICERCAAVPPG